MGLYPNSNGFDGHYIYLSPYKTSLSLRIAIDFGMEISLHHFVEAKPCGYTYKTCWHLLQYQALNPFSFYYMHFLGLARIVIHLKIFLNNIPLTRYPQKNPGILYLHCLGLIAYPIKKEHVFCTMRGVGQNAVKKIFIILLPLN